MTALFPRILGALSFGWPWLLLGLIPPAIVLLYFLKLKRMPLEVPSTYLWHRTIEDLHVNTIWQRLRQSLLLFLQLLVVAIIILACIPWPWQSRRLTGDRFIFLVDTSASMRADDVAPTRLDEAKRRIGEMIDEMQTGDVAMLISFSDVARVEQSFSDSRSQLKRKLAAIKQTSRSSDIGEALQAAAGLANPGRSSKAGDANDVQVADAQPATLYLLSDGGFEAVDNFDFGNLSPKYIKLGSDAAANVAVVAFTSERNPEKPTQTQAFARLENFGKQDVTVEAALYHGDALRDVKNVEIPGQGTAGVQYELTDVGSDAEVDEGVLRLEINHDDHLKSDNVAYVAMNAPRQVRLLVVTPENDALTLALGTDEALKLADVSYLKPAQLKAKAYIDEAAAGSYDMIIYDRCRPQRMPQANTLFIGTLPPLKTWTAGKPQVLPLVVDFDRVHPLMQFVEVGNVKIYEGFPLEPPSGSTVLIDADFGPLVAIGPREGFEDAVIGFKLFSVDKDGAKAVDSDWLRYRSFPIFMMNALRYLGGVRTTLSTANIKPGQPVVLRSAAPAQKIAITSPNRQRTEVTREGQNAFIYAGAETPGIYDVREGKSTKVAQQFAVNLFDSRESNLKPRAIDVGHTIISGSTGWEPAPSEIWKWILLAGLALLIFEWYIYNRRVYL